MLSKEKKKYAKVVHNIVYESFIGEIPVAHFLKHIDKNKKNNNINNLCLENYIGQSRRDSKLMDANIVLL